MSLLSQQDIIDSLESVEYPYKYAVKNYGEAGGKIWNAMYEVFQRIGLSFNVVNNPFLSTGAKSVGRMDLYDFEEEFNRSSAEFMIVCDFYEVLDERIYLHIKWSRISHEFVKANPMTLFFNISEFNIR